MKIGIIIPLLFLCSLSACTPARMSANGGEQHTIQGADYESESTSSLSFDPQLTQFLAASPEGSTRHFTHSTLGDDVTVAVGRAYTSALGEDCREAVASKAGMRPKRLAVCRGGQEGAWRLAPQIFSGGAH